MSNSENSSAENAVEINLTELTLDELFDIFVAKALVYAEDTLKKNNIDPATADREVFEVIAQDYLSGAADMLVTHPEYPKLESPVGQRMRGLAQKLRAVYV